MEVRNGAAAYLEARIRGLEQAGDARLVRRNHRDEELLSSFLVEGDRLHLAAVDGDVVDDVEGGASTVVGVVDLGAAVALDDDGARLHDD